MSQHESEKKLSPLLIKHKAEESDISAELNRVQKIFDERLLLLEETVSRTSSTFEELQKVRYESAGAGFISGQSSILGRVDNIKKRLMSDLNELKKEEEACQDLLKNAEKKLLQLKSELGDAFNSRRVVEKLTEMRDSVDMIINNAYEDYSIEELFTNKRDKKN